MSIYFHKDGTKPAPQGILRPIFVFGSNLAGIHGAGAARVAREHYNARWGVGAGPTGQSYAIPTKNYLVEAFPLEFIEIYIRNFVEYTQNNENKNFFVTRVGCGLAGHKDSVIAPMFKGAINCSFAEQWRDYLS